MLYRHLSIKWGVKMKYTNPVIRGCYPDPSICRVGEDYYVVNSTFEFFPAVPISHSKDLVNWDTIGHCITKNSQLSIMPGGRQSASGIYAPSIRYKDGIFYMVTTNMLQNKDQGNFYVYTSDPAGEWSDPIFLDTPGIDPSFFFDDDDKDYYVGTGDGKIYVVEIDLKTGKMLGERYVLWEGTGGAYPEGPHIYKKNGWYYLMISEGGTERSHMITMARSKSLTGGYEVCPHNPVFTNRSLLRPIEAVGHADLVEDQNGNWWAVCLGTRTFSYPPKHNLGRETMLVPVDFSGDWPVFGNNGTLDEVIEVNNLPVQNAIQNTDPIVYLDKFDKDELDLGWNYLYNPQNECYSYGDGRMSLRGNEFSLSDMEAYTWIGRRQRAHDTRAAVEMEFDCKENGEEAGFTIFMNYKHHYAAAVICEDGVRKIIFKRRIGTLEAREYESVIDAQTVRFEIESDKDWYSFYYSLDNGERIFMGKGETVYITTEVGGSFTGNYYAMYAMGNGKPSVDCALFTNFVYEEK